MACFGGLGGIDFDLLLFQQLAPGMPGRTSNRPPPERASPTMPSPNPRAPRWGTCRQPSVAQASIASSAGQQLAIQLRPCARPAPADDHCAAQARPFSPMLRAQPRSFSTCSHGGGEVGFVLFHHAGAAACGEHRARAQAGGGYHRPRPAPSPRAAPGPGSRCAMRTRRHPPRHSSRSGRARDPGCRRTACAVAMPSVSRLVLQRMARRPFAGNHQQRIAHRARATCTNMRSRKRQVLLVRHAAHVQHQRPVRRDAVLRAEARAIAGTKRSSVMPVGITWIGRVTPYSSSRWRTGSEGDTTASTALSCRVITRARQPGAGKARQQRHVVVQVVLEIGVAGGHHRHAARRAPASSPA